MILQVRPGMASAGDLVRVTGRPDGNGWHRVLVAYPAGTIEVQRVSRMRSLVSEVRFRVLGMVGAVRGRASLAAR